MSADPDRFVDSLIDLVYRAMNRRDAPMARVQYAVFLANNALDSNLCDIKLLDDSIVEGCPRLAGTTYSANDMVLVLTGPGVSYVVLNEVVGDVSKYGGEVTTPEVFVKTYNFSWACAYEQGGNPILGSNLYQGDDQVGGLNRRSLIGFDTNQIQADLAAATVVGCSVKLKYLHWYFGQGGTAVLGTHNQATQPGGFPLSGVNSNRIQSSSWLRNLTRNVDLGTTIGDEFQAGTTTGIVLGPGPSNDKIFYGYAEGSVGGTTPILTDSCTRSVTNGLGAATSGQNWVIDVDGPEVDYDVDGSKMVVTHPSAAVNHTSYVDVGSNTNDITFSTSCSVTAGGGSVSLRSIPRMVDRQNFYCAQLDWQTSGQLRIRIVETAPGSVTVLYDPLISLSYAPNEVFKIRSAMAGTSFMAKLWRAADPEPSSWTVSLNDLPSVPMGTRVGFLTLRQSANTDVNAQVTLDDFVVYNSIADPTNIQLKITYSEP